MCIKSRVKKMKRIHYRLKLLNKSQVTQPKLIDKVYTKTYLQFKFSMKEIKTKLNMQFSSK